MKEYAGLLLTVSMGNVIFHNASILVIAHLLKLSEVQIDDSKI